MTDISHLDWPFLEPRHKALATELGPLGRPMCCLTSLADHSVRRGG